MTYQQKFNALEQRAHSQIIATKILRDMTDLRSKAENSATARRRWVWELIQNAKDVHPADGVKITITLTEDGTASVFFKHNGKTFSTDNIRFLIEQISTKDRKKGDDGKRATTGKFGTGFLTTHLLSEIVKVNGIVKEPELDYVAFELMLDRSGQDIDDILEAVESAKLSVADLDEREPVDYNPGNDNTSFTYPLTDGVGLTIARAGMADLANCLPYSLSFVKEIKEVYLLPTDIAYRNITSSRDLQEGLQLMTIEVAENEWMDEPLNFFIALYTVGFTNLAIPFEKNGKVIMLRKIDDKTPRLFCDFPLIGTEDFPFPVIINNPNFNPTDPRDGIYLTSPARVNELFEENKRYMKEAVQAYFQLLKYASDNAWENLHLLADIPPLWDIPDWLDETWYNKEILNPIRKKLLKTKIVKTESGGLAQIWADDDAKFMWFPSASKKEIRKALWEVAKHWFPHVLPRESDIELWNRISWSDCGKLTCDQLAAFVQGRENLEKLQEALSEKNVIEWLNEFYEMLKLEDKEYSNILSKRAIFPNQNGDLFKLSQLNPDEGDITPVFKDVLKLLGKDIRAELLHDGIVVETETDILDQNYVIREINSEVSEKANDREIAKDYTEGFTVLLQWFQKEPILAKQLFPNLYRNKHLLYNEDQILENITKAEQLDDLLTEYNVHDLASLRKLIDQAGNNPGSLLPVTQEILMSMGITSLEDWEAAIQDKDLAALFSHESVPTTDMFIYAQSHIKKAIENIKQFLEQLADYDTEEMEQTAPTILAGIKKNGQTISIVARPAYKGQVIIYYGSERDTLDFEPSELWIDDDIEPRQLTLGFILKKAQIVKFPV